MPTDVSATSATTTTLVSVSSSEDRRAPTGVIARRSRVPRPARSALRPRPLRPDGRGGRAHRRARRPPVRTRLRPGGRRISGLRAVKRAEPFGDTLANAQVTTGAMKGEQVDLAVFGMGPDSSLAP